LKKLPAHLRIPFGHFRQLRSNFSQQDAHIVVGEKSVAFVTNPHRYLLQEALGEQETVTSRFGAFDGVEVSVKLCRVFASWAHAPKVLGLVQVLAAILHPPEWISVANAQVISWFDRSRSHHQKLSFVGEGLGAVSSTVVFQKRRFVVNDQLGGLRQGQFVSIY
jgi:hypothetical protein